MEITSEISSIITNTKEEFEKKFKQSLVTDTLRQVISKSIPANEVESKRLNDPDFREKFNTILSPITQEVINKFENVGQFDTGNLFSSMVNSISDSVALESTHRLNCVFNDIQLDRVPENAIESYIMDRFEPLRFTSKEIGQRAVENFKMILSTEDAAEVLDDIKDEVKDAIEETEDKNELVEGTTKEIIDYKKEMAPPDDQYENPEDAENKEDEGENDEGSFEEDSADDNADTDNEEEQENDQSNSEDSGDEADAGEETDFTEETQTENEGETDVEEPDSNNENDEEEQGGDFNESDADDGNDDVNADEEGLTEDENNPDVDINAELNENTDSSETEDSSNNSTPEQNSGIVINISGADLSKGKESLTLTTAEGFASRRVPTHPRSFDEMKLPSVIDMASEACNASGDIEKEFNIKFDSLRYGIHQVKDVESVKALENKLDELKNISQEAFKLAEGMKDSLYDMGLYPDGLANSKENTFFCAANIITRFLSKTKKISSQPLPYTSAENVLTNAFDILQLRKELKYTKGDVDNAKAEDLYSRESMFYKNIATIEDPELVKQASAVIDLTDMKLEKALTTNFITDYKIKAWEVNVGKNANKGINEAVTKRVEDKFEKLWCRKLNSDEKDIIQAVANNQDVTEIVPNPFEKFLIKLSKDTMFGGKSTESVKYNLSKRDKANIKFKAKIYTTLYKAAEKFDIIDSADEYSVSDFCDKFDIQ